MKRWFMNLSDGIKALIHCVNAIVFVAIPIAIEGQTNIPLMLLWLVNIVFGIIFIVWHSKARKGKCVYAPNKNSQADIENAQKILKIAKANRANPYVDITPMVLGFGFPFIGYNGFFASDNETIVYVCPANVFKDKEQVLGYRGKSTGTSVRVAKGLYWRNGQYNSRAVRADVRKYYDGDLIITNKRIIFIGKDESFECPVEKVTAAKLLSKNSFVLQYGRTSKNIGVDIALTEYAYGMINYVTQAYKDGEDVFDGIQKARADMTPEQQAFCIRVREETNNLKIPKEKTVRSKQTGCAKFLLAVFIIVAVVGIIVSIANNGKDPKPATPVEFSLSQYSHTETKVELNTLETVTFYLLPFDTTEEDLEIVNSNNEIATCTFKSVHAVAGEKLAVIYIKGIAEGTTTMYLKDKNSTSQSESIEITVFKKEEEVDNSRKVYINYSGDKYHFSKSCAGQSAYESTLNKVKNYKEPCSKCAH